MTGPTGASAATVAAAATPTGSWRRSLIALLRAGWRADGRGVIVVFALNVLSQACWLTSIVGIKLLFDKAIGHDEAGVLVAVVLIVGAGQLSFLCGMRQWSTSIAVTERTSQLLDEELMTITGGLPGVEHLERPEYADRIALVRQERRRIGFGAYVVALNLRIWIGLAGSVVLLARLHPLLLLLPGFAMASFATQSWAQRVTDRVTEETAEAVRRRRELFDLLTAAPAGKEVRVFGLKAELIGRHLALAEEIDGALARAAWRSAALQGAGRMVFAAGYLGSIALVLQRAIRGAATTGDLALAVTLAAGINAQVAQAAEEFAYLRRMVAIGHHYVWLREYATESAESALDHGGGAAAEVPMKLTDGLAVESLSFRYPGTDAVVLDDVSFRVPAGSTVALVGENGSGKTTLAKLLLRMYEPDKGAITIDGTSIGAFGVRAYRQRVCAAFQDYCRFELLARESVGVGDLARLNDEGAVLAALERAGADDVVAALPDALQTQLGRSWEGVDLSGGQWQKLAVARALMREAPLLLVFDEPTAALDPFSEHLLFDRVAAPGDRSTLLISHRFSTVRMADWIVVLRAGRILEAGIHEDLVKQGGLYAELYGLQARAYG